MKYTAVLFDLDGVIVDSEIQHFKAFRSALMEYGIPLSEQQFRDSFIGKTDKASFVDFLQAKQMASMNLNEIMAKKASYFQQLTSKQVSTYHDALTCISELTKRDQLMGLVTGSLRSEVQLILETLGLTQTFSVIITAEDVEQSKPSPEGYQRAAEKLHVSPAYCLVVEDAPKGIAAATAAGMRCLAVMHTYPATQLQEADTIVKKLTIDNF